jgi:molybdopterin synthase sulfur carrier subunit
MMKIRFYATLRQVIGGSEVEVELPETATIRDMLEAICSMYPGLKRELLDETGELYQHVHIFVNGRDAPFLEDGLDATLNQEDMVGIFPAVGGG